MTKQSKIFTDAEIANFAKFYDVLKRIHIRLVTEGYVIKEGVIEQPLDKQGNNSREAKKDKKG